MSKSNLTLSIDEDLLRRARIRALEQGTSVNAAVRDFLEGYVARRTAMEGFLAIAQEHSAGSAGAGRTWKRDEIYEERTGWQRS
ncbi:MAG: hypothetical protein ACRDWA_13005 [Acidimicrobiia bacterium]